MQHKPYTLEICCYSANDVFTAEQAGAQRVELCNGYTVGGTTPSLGCLQLTKALSSIPVYCMIRPFGGNFIYSESDKKVMLKDAELCLQNGADGLVFGALNNNGLIDETFVLSFCNAFKSVPITFHRAIDLCVQPLEALPFLIDCGVSTILSSGGSAKAIDGIDLLNAMHKKTLGKLTIMAGSGVNAENIQEFAKIGLNHFHSSASNLTSLTTNFNDDRIAFNAAFKNSQQPQVDAQKVSELITILDAYFLANE